VRERIGRGLVTVLSEKEVKKRKQREKERNLVACGGSLCFS